MNDLSAASDRLMACRYYVAAAGRPAFVADLPEWVAPALDAMIHGRKPVKLSRVEAEEIGRAGIPFKTSRKGAVLAAKVEAISLPPPEPMEQPSRPSNYCGW